MSRLCVKLTSGDTLDVEMTAEQVHSAVARIVNLYGDVVKTDTWIDARDPAYGQLLIWTDINHNGLSEPNELQSAAAAGLVAISTDAKRSKRKDDNGNEFRLWGPVVFNHGRGVVRDKAWDVWLRTTIEVLELTNP